MIVLVVLEALAIVVLGVLVFGLLRTHAEILRALDRAGVGLAPDEEAATPVGPVPVQSPKRIGAAADITGTVPGGGPVKVGVNEVRHRTLLAFLSSGCQSCAHFWEEFATSELELPGADTRLVIVAQDPEHDSQSAVTSLAPRGVKTVMSTSAWVDYEVPGSPYFALVDGPSGAVIGSGSATAWSQVKSLLEQALGDTEQSNARPHRGGSGADREQRADEALRSAGILPGDARLYRGPDTSAESAAELS